MLTHSGDVEASTGSEWESTSSDRLYIYLKDKLNLFKRFNIIQFVRN